MQLVVYSKDDCGPCTLVKNELERRGFKEGIDWEERNINKDEAYMAELVELGLQSVPVVTKDNEVLFHGFRPDIIEKLAGGNV